MELRPTGFEMRPPPGITRQLVVEAEEVPAEVFTRSGLPVDEEIPRRPSFPRTLAGASMLVLAGSMGVLAAAPSIGAAPEPPPAAAVVPDPVVRSGPSMISAEGWNVAEAASNQELLTPPRAAQLPGVQKGDYVKHRVNFSHLVSNQDFTDWQAANASDLQFFFESQGSFLADYQEDGRSAAQIVSAAAEKHQINPWVVLATLEKENSLVTRESQPGKATLRASMGYAYNDGGSTAGKHSTFGYQVEKGTALLRQLFEEGKGHKFPFKMRVDYGKRRLTVRNEATYALMRYTPHTTDTRLRRIGGGNFLFERHLVRFQSDYAHFYQEAD